MSTEAFLPAGYEAPASGGFTKFEAGETRLRILGPALLLWVVWEGGKSRRMPYICPDGKIIPKPPVNKQSEKDGAGHVWGLKVYNYNTDQMEVCELNSQKCIADLTRYFGDPDYGNPINYDVVVTKTVKGDKTTYSTTPKPPKPVDQKVIDAYEATPIDLSQLLVVGGNPFSATSAGSQASTQQAPQQKVVTPENYVHGDAIPAGYKVNPIGGGLMKDDRPF